MKPLTLANILNRKRKHCPIQRYEDVAIDTQHAMRPSARCNWANVELKHSPIEFATCGHANENGTAFSHQMADSCWGHCCRAVNNLRESFDTVVDRVTCVAKVIVKKQSNEAGNKCHFVKCNSPIFIKDVEALVAIWYAPDMWDLYTFIPAMMKKYWVI